MDSNSIEQALAEVLPHDFQWLKNVLDKLPIGVMVEDKKGVIVYYNKAHGQLDGYEPEEVIGRVEDDIYYPELCPDLNAISRNRAKPITGFISKYKTRRGMEVEGAYWVYPVIKDGIVTGSINITLPLAKNVRDPGRCPPLEWPQSMPINMPPNSIIGTNPSFTRALRIVDLSADSPSPVLIVGETGTGKEVFAKLIHEKSYRKNKPFLALNCAAIPATLIESLLMGTTKGSFTGAVDRPGIFEEASGGTVFLDEIDSMPLELQPKLLRVIQEMSLTRLGSNELRNLNFKLVSSVSRQPDEILEQRLLRQDLFYRLAVIVVNLPPLRERLDDLEDLANYFISKYNTILGRQVIGLEPELMLSMKSYHWPGNVRELEYMIAGAMNMVPDEACIIKAEDLYDHHALLRLVNHRRTLGADRQVFSGDRLLQRQQPDITLPPPNPFMSPFERSVTGQMEELDRIKTSLTATRGNVAKAARGLNMSRQLLHYKVMKYRLNISDFKKF
jgi:arginine utilization regulatory protein